MYFSLMCMNVSFFFCPLLRACTPAVRTHTRAHMQRSITHPCAAVVTSVTLIRCRSSHNHIHKHAQLCVCVCVCVCICCVFAFLSTPDSWMPNSLFLLETGILSCPPTSCRPCQPAFLPGFHRLDECACFSWLFTEYCACVKTLNLCECVCV